MCKAVQSDRHSRHTGTALCMRAVGRLRPARASGADSLSWALSTSGHGHAAVCQVPRVQARRGLETYIGPRVARTYAVALGPNVALSVPLVTLHHSQSLRRPTGPLMSHFSLLEAACLAVPRLRGRACRLLHCRLGDVSIALERRATQLFRVPACPSPPVHHGSSQLNWLAFHVCRSVLSFDCAVAPGFVVLCTSKPTHRFSFSRRDAVSFSRSTQPSLAGLRMSNLAYAPFARCSSQLH